ncbi:MAG TPA: hypothetical protein VK993_00545, partial [Chthoniobacterales bacterium]|nr:hypothetical protein [Chthoniobacterales bacterium]
MAALEFRVQENLTFADLQHCDANPGEAPVRLGVFGHPVAHSLSPRMQNAALEYCGLEMRYAAFDIAPGELEQALHLLP